MIEMLIGNLKKEILIRVKIDMVKDHNKIWMKEIIIKIEIGMFKGLNKISMREIDIKIVEFLRQIDINKVIVELINEIHDKMIERIMIDKMIDEDELKIIKN